MASEFDKATSFVGSRLAKIVEPSEEQQLKFYGLFKQAKQGDCTDSKPWGWNFVAVAKWKAWNACKSISSDDAQQKYIDHLTELCPTWRETTKNNYINSSGDSSQPAMMGGVFSRPIEEDSSLIVEGDKTIFDFASDGNISKITSLLKTSCDVDETDSEGRTILHIACDRGHIELVKTLINDYGANVNTREMENHTPLHFAVLCEEEEICRILINSSADVSIANNDGETAVQFAEGNSISALFA